MNARLARRTPNKFGFIAQISVQIMGLLQQMRQPHKFYNEAAVFSAVQAYRVQGLQSDGETPIIELLYCVSERLEIGTGVEKMSRTRIENPIYQQIAVDLAGRIAAGQYKAQERIRGRSTLASYYNVSPETIRKAMSILAEVGIVRIRQGVGIEVVSVQNAREFQEKYSSIYNMDTLRRELLALVQLQQEQGRQIREKMNELIDCTERFRNLNPLTPFALEITGDMNYLGKTASEILFWQNTAATVIAIKREGSLILSPGSYATLKEGDIWYLIGTEESFNRAKAFLKKG